MGASNIKSRSGKQKGGFNKVEMIGSKFGKLTVIEKSHKRGTHTYWKCECKCGEEHVADGSHLRQGNITKCKKCYVVPVGENHSQWNGVGDISGDWWYSHVIRNTTGTKTRKPKDINITIDDGWELFQKQKGLCSISGLQLYFPEKHKQKGNASLDRIDNSKGYVKGNIQWLHKDVNMLKHTRNQSEFIELCKTIAKYNETTGY